VGAAAQTINKLVESHGIEIDPAYINLKLSEMQLLHEFQKKKQAELEEQRAVREQMREKRKLALNTRSAARSHAGAGTLSEGFAEAQAKMASAHGAELDRLNETVALLSKRLEEAKEKGLRAQSMAELTKSGMSMSYPTWFFRRPNVQDWHDTSPRTFGKNR